MKNLLAILAIMSFTMLTAQKNPYPNLVTENIPEIPQELVDQMTQYQNTRSAVLLGWNPRSDQMLMSTRFAETPQLHILSQPLGARKQITFFKEPVGNGSFPPDPKFNGIIYAKDVGGNEFTQLYWFDLNSGKHSLVSDGGRSQNGSPRWSNSGDKFVYTSTRRNKKDYDLYLVNMNNPFLSKMVLEVKGSWRAVDWSPDDKHLIVAEFISVNQSRLYIMELETGKLEEINPSKEMIAYNDAAWSADGKGIFMVNDDGTEFQTMKHYDIVTKKFKAITVSLNWDVSNLIMSRSRDRIVFSVNEGGFDKLYEMNTATMKYMSIDNIPKGIIGSFLIHPNGKTLGISVSNAQTPGDIFTYRFADKNVTRYTESETGGLDNTRFPAPLLIKYQTFDDVTGKPREIPAFVYKPQNAKAKMPVIINIHGGPEGQSRPSFNPFVTFLNNELGAIVIQPNVRGSTGYGKTYVKLDNGLNREESVKDIGKLIEWIKAQPDMDPERVAVIGGSYGGYMTLASMTHFNDRLRCGVDVVGISNFVTFLKNTEDYRKDLRRVEYGDERDPNMQAFLEAISPSNNVNKITKPMLIVQGANDPRVPMSEAEQMKKKLQEKGNDTWYLLANDEGHGFRKKMNVDYYQWSVILFFKKYLLN
jgi:dipeptidyl aminopeptidase/acylaminoacyl peptidase